MSDDAPVTLPLNCVACGRPVTVRYLPHDNSETAMQSWACPYEDCRNPNTIGVSGTVLDAVARYGPKE